MLYVYVYVCYSEISNCISSSHPSTPMARPASVPILADVCELILSRLAAKWPNLAMCWE